MNDMPAYDPDARTNDVGDEFADDLSGNVYPMPRSRSRQGLYGLAQSQLLGLAEGGKADLVRNIAAVVGIVREIAAQVEGLGVQPFAGYAQHASTLVGELHDTIADKSVETLIDDGRALVRQQPEIAIAAALIAGFIGARLLKART
jgi:hypothetical protein